MSTLRCSCKQLLMPAGEENIHPSTWSCDIQYWPSITNLLEENYNIGSAVACSWKHCHCHPKGPYYRDWVHIGTFLAFWVPIGSLFIFQGPYFQCFDYIYVENINSVCNAESAWIQQWVNMVCLWWVISCMLSYILLFRVTLLTNFDFYLCLRVNWVPISQKVGSLSQSLGVPIRLWDSV